MQASNLEYYLKKRKEEKEYREDLKELIYYASTELGITTNRISWVRVLLAIIIMILVIIMLKKFMFNHLAKSQVASSVVRDIFS